MRPSASWNSSAPRIAAALVQQIAGDRGEPGPIRRIVRGARREQQQRVHHRDVAMLDGPDAQPVGEHAAPDLGEGEGRLGTERRQPGAIDGHQDTDTGVEPVEREVRAGRAGRR